MTKQNSAGFTIVEMLISIIVTALFIELLFQFAEFYLSTSTKTQTDLTSTAERMDATDLIREVLVDSSGMITQNSINDANAPDGSGTTWPVLHPTANGAPYASAVGAYQPLMYFKRIAKKTDGNLAIQNSGTACNNEYVLYRNTSNREIRLRTLAYTMNAATCNGTNTESTTCPPTSTRAGCVADKLILSNVSSFLITYYNRNGVQMVYDANNLITTDMPDVEVANITLSKWTLSNYDTKSQNTVTSSVRIALRNT